MIINRDQRGFCERKALHDVVCVVADVLFAVVVRVLGDIGGDCSFRKNVLEEIDQDVLYVLVDVEVRGTPSSSREVWKFGMRSTPYGFLDEGPFCIETVARVFVLSTIVSCSVWRRSAWTLLGGQGWVLLPFFDRDGRVLRQVGEVGDL